MHASAQNCRPAPHCHSPLSLRDFVGQQGFCADAPPRAGLVQSHGAALHKITFSKGSFCAAGRVFVQVSHLPKKFLVRQAKQATLRLASSIQVLAGRTLPSPPSWRHSLCRVGGLFFEVLGRAHHHASVAKRLRACAWAPWYQRDISSMDIQVKSEQPTSA